MAFARGAAGLSQVPSCCETILGLTVESVQGNMVYVEWIWTRCHLEWWHAPKSYPRLSGGDCLLLRFEGNARIPFPMKQCNGTSLVSLVLCGDMKVSFPLELEKQCQASRRVNIGNGGFLLRCYRAVTPAIMFWVDPRVDCPVSAGEAGVSGVDWDIVVFWNCATTTGVLLEFQVETASS